jgi:integrase
MAGHIQDRWYKDEKQNDGTIKRVKTDRYGTGMRYRARYIGPDGTEKSKSFPDRQKRAAEAWLSQTQADMERGQYINPKHARTTFQQYAEKWLASRTTDSQDMEEMRLRLHAFPRIGSRPLGSFQPEHIREWLGHLKQSGVPGSYAQVIYAHVRSVLGAAVDDGYLARNPCAASSVKAPKAEVRRVTPWTLERVMAVRAGLDGRYRAMVDLAGGCGLRQGEVFGIAVDALDFEVETLHVVRQVKLIRGKPVFAPPKGGKLRDVPLPTVVARALRAQMKAFPPVEITLPWRTLDGPLVTHRLIFTNKDARVVLRSDFNKNRWKAALAAAGVIPARVEGKRYDAAREHGMHALRHFYASVLLDAGESIKAVSEYLGHADPGFTLRIYVHLMPSSQQRTRKAVDNVFQRPELDD